MSESPNKKIKRTVELPDDLTLELPEHLVEYIISTYFPIQYVLQNRVVSKTFREAAIRSRDLDFGRIYSRRRSQSAVVRIIEEIFNQHKGSEINRFVLILNHLGVEDKVLSWVKTCLSKNIQELTLDFSKSKKVMDLCVDFSAIKTLTVLKLRWCKFEIPNNTPKGLRLLRSLALMKSKVTPEMIDAIFSNCFHLETQMDNAWDAPTLECYKYEEFVRILDFSRVDALKEAKLHYIQNYNWRYYDSSNMVLANMVAYTGVHVLSTTNIFLEAFKERYIEGEMRSPIFKFLNLKEFCILFKAPNLCTLYHISEFLKRSPKVEKVLIDIKKFTFEPGMLWIIHQKSYMESSNYKFNSIKEVTIDGYKNHWHELDIVEFFCGHAKSLKKLKLIMPKNVKKRARGLDYARLDYIRSRFPCVKVEV
uniref:F-box/LRR-repeat protein 15/At3g58940/PEG3-like LRR domain-containing protein n=1 Tax=Brassica oleracea var. oleracea TaxID=109376 RepID=A0A0D3AAP5_BRAOL